MRRHDTDLTALVAGLTFCGIAVAYLLGEAVGRSLDLRWVVPILLIGLGVAGLSGTVLASRRDRLHRRGPWE
jgi:hypothetical protein